jgi:hypothetical protein
MALEQISNSAKDLIEMAEEAFAPSGSSSPMDVAVPAGENGGVMPPPLIAEPPAPSAAPVAGRDEFMTKVAALLGGDGALQKHTFIGSLVGLLEEEKSRMAPMLQVRYFPLLVFFSFLWRVDCFLFSLFFSLQTVSLWSHTYA